MNAMLMRTKLWQELRKDAGRLEANHLKKLYGPKEDPATEPVVETNAEAPVEQEPSVDDLASLLNE